MYMKPLLILVLTVSLLQAQGPLTPPGAPAPIMKTLAQIEARTAISGNNGLTPAAGPYFTISSSGSYYLTGNIIVLSGDAIRINASGVTLDLNGFSILSASTATGGSGVAIYFPASQERIHISNGTISCTNTTGGFLNGIIGDFNTITQATFTDLTLSQIVQAGIISSDNSSAERCQVTTKTSTAISCTNTINCTGTSDGGIGISATNATNCTGSSGSSRGIFARNATNCFGTSSGSIGLLATVNATNCRGNSDRSYGLYTTNATNCYGSASGTGFTASIAIPALRCTGLFAANASNCTGVTSIDGGYGIFCEGTASFCRGINESTAAARTALQAAIAVACTTGGGQIVSSQKHLGTP